MKEDEDTLAEVEFFERRTFREVTIWDWLGRVLPMSILAAIIICYFFRWNNALELILEVSTVVFFIVCFIWWYWALYKIAVSVKYMRQSHQKFIQINKEIISVKKIIKTESE